MFRLVVLRDKWLVVVMILAAGVVGVIGAAKLVAQSPASGPSAVVPVQQPTAAPTITSSPIDPARLLTFANAPHGPVKLVNKRTPNGKSIQYYRFTSKGARTYIVEIPVSQTKTPRSSDDWITLFACYGRDPQGEADTRALLGVAPVQDHIVWSNLRIGEQAIKVAAIQQSLAKQTQQMALWAVIHQEAKDTDNKVKAQDAWARISTAKYDIKVSLGKLAKEKLNLGKRYKDAGQFEQANNQFRQTAELQIWPYSAEAVAKLRATEGAGPVPAAFSTAAAVGLERISLSDLYQAAQKALRTTAQ